MKIKWFGHSCFLLTSHNETRILIDPFDPSVGYQLPYLEADVVAITHNHYDHNNINAVKGDFVHLSRPGKYNAAGFDVHGIHTWHDTAQGAKRGSNTMYVFEIDGLRICHCGDLGIKPGETEIEEIGQIDILMVPVGGTYTIDASAAMETAGLLNPAVIIPMHYKTPACKLALDTIDKFLDLANNETKVKYFSDEILSSEIDIIRPKSSEIHITKDSLPKKTTIIVMNY
jgi:L-ascorbate metabolism protein UlaG (beta-lactamase superfamily)